MNWFDVLKSASSIMMKWLRYPKDGLKPDVMEFPGKDGKIREMFIKMIEDMQYKYRDGETLYMRFEDDNMKGEYYLESQEFNDPYFRFQIGPKENNPYDQYERLEKYHIYFKESRNRGNHEREDWDALISMLLATDVMGGA